MHEYSVPVGAPVNTRTRNPRRVVVALAAGLAATLAPLAVLAQSTTHYQVEVVIFAQPDGSAELRPLPRAAPSARDAADLEPGAPGAPAGAAEAAAVPSGPDEAASWLPPGFTRARLPLALEPAAARLNRGGYQLLWHQAWVQAPTDRGPMELPLLAALGQGPANANLSGRIQFSAARFLHLAVDLELQSAGVPVAELRQRRRVRIAVQHYYDHPHIGVLAIVRPVPAELVQPPSP
jgi:hypothetical protein